MGRDAAPTGDDHCLRLSIPAQHVWIPRHWSWMVVVFLVEEEVVWSGAAQGREGTNVKPRHVHTYALWAVKKDVQKLYYYQKHVAAAEEEREIV